MPYKMDTKRSPSSYKVLSFNTYREELNRHDIAENEKGRLPQEILKRQAGLDIDLIAYENMSDYNQ